MKFVLKYLSRLRKLHLIECGLFDVKSYRGKYVLESAVSAQNSFSVVYFKVK